MNNNSANGLRTIRPNDPEYSAASACKNSRIRKHPSEIIFCTSEQDVLQAMHYVVSHELPFVIRSGGHSYEGYSLIDDGVVVDLSEMSSISVDAKGKIASVQSGASLQKLQAELAKHNLALPAGTCNTVGIAGITLGGGYGLISRKHGLTVDKLKSVRLLLDYSKFEEVSPLHHDDLFWACTGGGGGNFSVASEFSFQCVDASPAISFRLDWSSNQMRCAVNAWQNWAPFVDERLTSLLIIATQGKHKVYCIGLFLGGKSELKSLTKTLIEACSPPPTLTLDQHSILDASIQHNVSRVGAEDIGVEGRFSLNFQDGVSRFKNTSDFIANALPANCLDTINHFWNTPPPGQAILQFDAYGGAINAVGTDKTAFPHRGNTLFSIQYQTYWEREKDDAQCIEWIRALRTAMQPFVRGDTYVNYCDADLTDYEKRYFSSNLDRLREIKQKYDPKNFFRFPQSIRT
ncbi:MAG: FAD-binding oxidoreductase [Cyanobacteria bacterium SZAS-4]|nr:FAD-binding oxidoreductase [Cyanobacteria bacterium SZAS-4]